MFDLSLVADPDNDEAVRRTRVYTYSLLVGQMALISGGLCVVLLVCGPALSFCGMLQLVLCVCGPAFLAAGTVLLFVSGGRLRNALQPYIDQGDVLSVENQVRRTWRSDVRRRTGVAPLRDDNRELLRRQRLVNTERGI